MPASFEVLIRNTPRTIARRAAWIGANLLRRQVAKDEEGSVIIYQFQTQTHKKRTGPYLCEVHAYTGEERPDPRDLVWVSCTCSYWLFYCEVAVFNFGRMMSGPSTTNIQFSNGAPPKVRNPMGVPMICKHLYRCFQIVLSTQAPGQNVKTQGAPQGATTPVVTVDKKNTKQGSFDSLSGFRQDDLVEDFYG